MFLVIDNYDSFVYNLARYLALAGVKCKVVRNDAITVRAIQKLKPQGILLSPGPGMPEKAGICVDLIKKMGASTPILGVCLGHQCIGEAYGGRTVRSQSPVHGKSCTIIHKGCDIFEGLPSPMRAGRYHSLISELPEDAPLLVTARNTDSDIMAMRHAQYPVFGVQFHPESVLTEHGHAIIENFTALALHWCAGKQSKQTLQAA